MTKLAADGQGHRIQAIRPNLGQKIVVGATSTPTDNAVSGGSSIAIIGATVDSWIAVGPAPVALDDGTTGFLFAGAMLYIRVVPGVDKVAFMRMGSTDGVGFVMEDTET